MVEYYYNNSINEASKHSLFEVSYGFQLAPPAQRRLPLTSAPAHIAEGLTELASIRDVVRDYLHFLSNVWLLVLPHLRQFLLWMILFSYLLKGYTFITHKGANT